MSGVHGKRYLQGELQYLLSWEGYEEMTWQYVDKLNCFALIEDYECNVEQEQEQQQKQ